MITVDRLKELLRYEPETGKWFWRISKGGIAAGTDAGTLVSNGYIKIGIDRKKYLAHRLAWFYTMGVWPTEIDHIDLNKQNNKWLNLRVANRSQNMGNTMIRKNNTSGHKGVRWNKKSNKWVANITIDRKVTHIGLYDRMEDAIEAYQSKAVEHFGEFVRHG